MDNKFLYTNYIDIRRVNDQIEFLESQFALVGDKLSNEKSVLMVDGPADFLLYTSGRRNVQFGHWWLKMKPRNDILTFFTTQVLALVGYAKPSTDRVVSSSSLNNNLVTKKKKKKRILFIEFDLGFR